MPNSSRLTLYAHPLSSFCWKVLMALWENATPFTYETIQGRPADHAVLRAHSPAGKMPLLHDEAGDAWISESTIIIEYLQLTYPGAVKLVPAGAEGLEARTWDRFLDLHVHLPMQSVVAERMRPDDQKDPSGAAAAIAALRKAYSVLEARMATRTWAAGEAFTLADCAAVPALFYANAIAPFTADHPALSGYFERLIARPSAQRAIGEAQPWFEYFPIAEALDARFTGPEFARQDARP